MVLKYVGEASAEKRITDDDIAEALGLERNDIIRIRKGGGRLHWGHLKVLMEKFNLEPSLFERWS